MREIKAYKSFRLYITKTTRQSTGYRASVTEWQMWETEDGPDDSEEFLSAGSASANESNGSYSPSNAIDGNNSSYWRAESRDGDKWLRVDLLEPKIALRMRIVSKYSSSYAPQNFILQGSNDDGETWEDIWDIRDFANSTVDKSLILTRFFRGKALLPDGSAASRVCIFRWDNMGKVADLTPEPDGYWQYIISEKRDYMIVFFGPNGFRPIAEGPVSAPLIEV